MQSVFVFPMISLRRLKQSPRESNFSSPRRRLLENKKSLEEKTMIKKAMFQVVVLAGVLVLGSMFAGGASANPVSQHVTLTGWVSCTTCLMPNTCKAQTRLSCTQWWVSQGASYVLVVGDSRYVLSGSEKDLAKAAAENSVTVSGDLDGTQLSVATVNF